MNVLVIQPGFPAEIPYFVRGLARQGARVLGVGDQPEATLPPAARDSLTAYLRVQPLWREEALISALRQWQIPVKLDRAVCLWEPGMMLAAAVREAFNLPGMRAAQTLIFRDKELMKQALDKAGIRTPRHFRARTQQEIRSATAQMGYPVIVKPIAGAGSANTYRVNDEAALEKVLLQTQNVAEMSVEEFIEGREYTYDTICANGRILYDNLAWYRPNCLIARSQEWVSPQTVTLRDMDSPIAQKARALGRAVLTALNFQTGFTHMEWFLKPNGEAVFGEIGARPPGGRSVELMNYACDIDVFEGWAEALIHGRLSQKVARKYNAGVVFKRALGQGHIQRVEGLRDIRSRFKPHLVCEQLSPIGAPRRDWKQTLISDGYLIFRHASLEQTLAMTDYAGEHLRLFAG